MDVIDLVPEHEPLFHVCLEDWSDEIKEGRDRRARWHARMKERGLRVKLARDDRGTIAGMIQYSPIEHAFVEGEGLYFIHCIWIHAHKRGPGDCRKHGLGTALLAAAENDARERGAKGMAAWGLWLPFWMRASWFKRHGYGKADREGMQVLVWKPFAGDASRPRWIRPSKRKPDTIPDKVCVTAYSSGWCSALNMTCERAKRACAELGDKVVYREIDTFERTKAVEAGYSDAVFVDGTEVTKGPPPSFVKLKRLIEKRARRL